MIEAIKENGQDKARVTCDDCKTELILSAQHGDTTRATRGSKRPRAEIKNEGHVIKKIKNNRWALIKGKHLCEKCVEARHHKEESEMTNVTEIRKPTPKQRREIIAMLEIAYDDEAKRYKGSDTDKSIAEAIGGGVMSGWVAETREELFGPDGSNAEIEEVQQQLAEALQAYADLKKDMTSARSLMQTIETDMITQKGRMDRAISRIEAIKQAVGPKAKAI